MYFRDLDLCRYSSGAFDAESWAVPSLAFGWLERGHHYTQGPAAEGLLSKLAEMRLRSEKIYSVTHFRGLHVCSLCVSPIRRVLELLRTSRSERPGLANSHINLILPGKGCVYVASDGIEHYIERHGYLPPREFIDAVFECAEYGSPEFQAALRDANHGMPPPWITNNEQSANRPARNY